MSGAQSPIGDLRLGDWVCLRIFRGVVTPNLLHISGNLKKQAFGATTGFSQLR